MQQTRDTFGITPVRLDRHGLQGALHLPRFHQHDRLSRLGQPAMQPLRQGAGLKPDRCNHAVLISDPAQQRIGLAGHLRLPQDPSMLADHADRGFLQRHIQSDKQFHPVVLHVDPIREWRQLALESASVTGGSRRRPRYGIS